MTTLVSWIGVDSRAPASIYLASDSRMSWEDKTWDRGRKLFASRNHPEILGYCGDVVFPSQALGQMITLIDSNAFFSCDDSSESKWDRIISTLQGSFGEYPNTFRRPFDIVYCTRENSGMASVFRMARLSWERVGGWTEEHWLDLPRHSSVIHVLGSGKKTFDKWYSYWNETREGRTSRCVFGAFCDALHSGEDGYSGGAPQLVGLYRKGPAESFGILHKGKRYLLGLPVEESKGLDAVEWRNSLFERCDWRTMQPLKDAQRHPRPRGLGNA